MTDLIYRGFTVENAPKKADTKDVSSKISSLIYRGVGYTKETVERSTQPSGVARLYRCVQWVG